GRFGIEPFGERLKVFADQVDQAEAIPVGSASHTLVKIPAHETAIADLVESGFGGLLLHLCRIALIFECGDIAAQLGCGLLEKRLGLLGLPADLPEGPFETRDPGRCRYAN